jgi:hypothetical protein
MDLVKLKEIINKLISELENGDRELLKKKMKDLISAFPFNEYEYMLMFLRDKDILTFNDYQELREAYVKSNKYLHLYGIAPRVFGQIWGEAHLLDIDKRFRKGSKKLDPSYNGQYDIWLNGIRIEVKACRAINTKLRGDLVSKALYHDSKEPFWMNFQQLKPRACDVFIFIGVWVDRIVYWVMTSKEVENNKYISHQHRGGIEYQIGITDRNIEEFQLFRVEKSDIFDVVMKKVNK